MIDFPSFQRRVLEAGLDVCRRYRLAIAGGYSIKAHGLVDRPSQDLDFATDSFHPLDEILYALADAYRFADLDVEVLEGMPRMARLVVTDPLDGQKCEVDLLKEALQRTAVDIGELRVIHFEDAVGMKLRALHDRSVARDYIDAAAVGTVLPFVEMERLTRLHADHFSPRALVENLEGSDYIDDEEFARYGLDEDAIREIRRFAFAWAEDIKARRAADGDAEADFDPDITEALYRD